MATVDWPTSAAFRVSQYSLGSITNKSRFEGFLDAEPEEVSHLADRLTCNVSLPPCLREHAYQRSGFLMDVDSAGHFVRFGLWKKTKPVGTLRGSPTVGANVLAAARSLPLVNARAGENLLRGADSLSTFLGTGWTLVNATLTANAAADPSGGNTASVLSRTATGNHYAMISHTVASTATRTFTAVVWLRAGTLTGNVVLRLRDGAGITDRASVTVTPTSTWAYYTVSATFPAGTAANVQLYVDPANDAGSAGDTLLMWYADIRLQAAIDTNCTAWAELLAPPAGQQGLGVEIRRTSASNAYSAFVASTTAHANKTYTFSVWLKSGTFSGGVTLYLRDGVGATIGTFSVASLPATWTRYSVTGTFGPTPAADIVAFVDQAEGGSIGETFGCYGALINLGSTPADFYPWPTLETGDVLGIGGNLLVVGHPGAVGDITGAITVPLALPAQRAMSAATAVTWDSPKGSWRLVSDGIDIDYGPAAVQKGASLLFKQKVV